jgi:hypothetical protein
MKMKTWPYKMVASPEEDNLVVFYYLLASEIWPHQKGGLWGLIRGGLL